MASSKAAEAGDIRPANDPSVEDQMDRDEIVRGKTVDRIIRDAKNATEKEQKMTLWEGIRLYPKAILWSMLISTCIVMEGYDICLINNFCRHPCHP
jgi:MFS transporter, SP family, general alpha glucoside:H+ symporter